MNNLSEYLVNNTKQIEIYLKKIASEKCLIAASFGENRSFLTAILDIDTKNKIITIDCGPKEYLNRELLNLGVINCKADFGGIKVLFEGREIKKAGIPGQTALSIKLPEQLYWVQRRSGYRMRSPLSRNSYCSVKFIDETLSYKLYDLSVSGFALISDTEELANKLTLSTEYTDCKLVLENEGTHIISFFVQSKFPLNADRPKKSQRIGCKFINTTLRAESTFLRYMQIIEREIMRNQK